MKECKCACVNKFVVIIPRAFDHSFYYKRWPGRAQCSSQPSRKGDTRRSPPRGASPQGPERARGPRPRRVECPASSAHRAAAGHPRTDGEGQTNRTDLLWSPPGTRSGPRAPVAQGTTPHPRPGPGLSAGPQGAPKETGAGQDGRESRGGEAGAVPPPRAGRVSLPAPARWGVGSRSGSAPLPAHEIPRRRRPGLPG